MPQRVPVFVRTRVKTAIEGYVRDRGYPLITANVVAEVRLLVGDDMHRGR